MANTTQFIPEEYEKKVRRTIPYYQNFQKETIDLLRTVKPDCNNWLDTGCGTGSLAELAIDTFDNCTFHLNDPSENMINYVKKRLEGNYTRRMFFHNFTTLDLPVSNIPEFEVITAIQSHHYMNREERAAATAKCFGMLKEGGIYVTFENIIPGSEKATDIALNRWKRYQLKNGKEDIVVEEHLKRFNTAYFPITIEEHLELLRETGFSTYELFWTSYMQAGFYAIK
ncbi:class I SAM-dependent methyltransferase [Methanococcoides orientis]|uniref:class I SAM-dependent methyltransferase n=1 Tax=Methanococcoides orientis TaxID=2822137 RepID=UPI001E3A315C|nr:class I SAM-dependent methyltransferase [Methanococcoides orientis]UGV40159.1 class I SAM-dependent methyltransferase [Methanococcoides orientis]